MNQQRPSLRLYEMAVLGDLNLHVMLKIVSLAVELKRFVVVNAQKVEIDERFTNSIPYGSAFDSQGGGRLEKWNDVRLQFFIDVAMLIFAISPLG